MAPEDAGPPTDEHLDRPRFSSHRALMNGILFSNCFAWAEGTVTAILALSSVLVDEDLYARSGRMLYVGFCIGTFFGPWVTGRLGLKHTLVLGLVGFSLYAASFIYPSDVAMQVAASLSGLFGSFLWTAQGVYFTSNAAMHAEGKVYEARTRGRSIVPSIQFKHSIGLMSGIFAGVFPFAMAACKLAASFILEVNESRGPTVIYILYASIAVLCTIGMAFVIPLKPIKKNRRFEDPVDRRSTVLTGSRPSVDSLAEAAAAASSHLGDAEDPPMIPNASMLSDLSEGAAEYADKTTCLSVWNGVVKMLRLSIDPVMLLMAPTNIAFGLMAGYFPLVVTKLVSDEHGKDLAGYLYALSGGAAFLLAFPYGYVSNRFHFGRCAVMLWGAASFAGAMVTFWQAEVRSIWAFAALFILYGSGNTVWQGTCMAVFADYWHQNAAPAFALLKLQSGFATAVAYFVFPKTSFTHSELALQILIIIACGSVTYLATVVISERAVQPGCQRRYGVICCCFFKGTPLEDDTAPGPATTPAGGDLATPGVDESESLLVLKTSFIHPAQT
eukprot:TRINITY_DN28563_c0_g1_i1.p1 TRINITY_DN28563_c0_g1~~TRINITY_DN28563_c0_g1_i1.p1  ORF type:complete len:585 (+),score=157.22 TRINITY_DN28563_c0_g1_i1:87-1757(+)